MNLAGFVSGRCRPLKSPNTKPALWRPAPKVAWPFDGGEGKPFGLVTFREAKWATLTPTRKVNDCKAWTQLESGQTQNCPLPRGGGFAKSDDPNSETSQAHRVAFRPSLGEIAPLGFLSRLKKSDLL